MYTSATPAGIPQLAVQATVWPLGLGATRVGLESSMNAGPRDTPEAISIA
jgi:hypothetical protein